MDSEFQDGKESIVVTASGKRHLIPHSRFIFFFATIIISIANTIFFSVTHPWPRLCRVPFSDRQNPYPDSV